MRDISPAPISNRFKPVPASSLVGNRLFILQLLKYFLHIGKAKLFGAIRYPTVRQANSSVPASVNFR
jgi:hypothetical protein